MVIFYDQKRKYDFLSFYNSLNRLRINVVFSRLSVSSVFAQPKKYSFNNFYPPYLLRVKNDKIRLCIKRSTTLDKEDKREMGR